MTDILTNPDAEEAVTIPTIAESWRVPTEAIQEAVDEAISQLPPVNDATLTIKQNGTTKGTFTANDADNTTIELEDTTYEDFTGTDGTSAGTAGLVPAPTAQDADKFLKSDGTWATGGGGTVILYDETGQNTDGAMTQKATTDALGGKQDKLTAGANITIDADNEISATDTTYTAGANVQISADNEISATDTTYSDFTGTDGVTAGTAGLVPAPATTDAGKYLKADGSWDTVSGGIPTNATFWGASYDSVNNKVDGSLGITHSSGNTSFIKGFDSSTKCFNIYSTGSDGSGALWQIGRGAGDSSGTRDIGLTQTGLKIYRPLNMASNKISSVADPTSAQDAATKNYTDNLAISYSAITGSAAPTTATEGKYVGQLYYDSTNDAMYYLSAITAQGTTPETYEYTWNAFGGGGSGIPTDATFWGRSYDAVNNKVDGNIKVGNHMIGTSNGVLYFGTASGGWYGKAFGINNIGTPVFYVDVSMSNKKIIDLADPTSAKNAATKNYVDNFYPVGTVYTSTSATAPTIAGGTWTEIGTQTIGSSTVHYYERTA